MNVEFDRSFLKNIDRIKDSIILKKLEKTITKLEDIELLSEIRNLRKLAGFKKYYRIRIGNYRLGFELISKNTIRLITIADRKDIYKQFP